MWTISRILHELKIYKPPFKLEPISINESFNAYGISSGKIDDPNKKSILALFNEIHNISEKLKKLESKVENAEFMTNYFPAILDKVCSRRS